MLSGPGWSFPTWPEPPTGEALRIHPEGGVTTYLSETLWGGSVDIASLALTGLLVVLAGVSAAPRRGGERETHQPPELPLVSVGNSVGNKDTS
ncbi:hypothetical protein ACFY12_16950 [Streptomyces sp. NPDC001339]|uniref:hypothetical protein n=1 Tax=Streptomyces sp. NPDC001339 TaxID=3364563 RepID=UPI003682C4D9